MIIGTQALMYIETGEANLIGEKSVVITVYGHGKVIDKIAIGLFNEDTNRHTDSNAGVYCETINSLELKENTWVMAKIISENTPYYLDFFCPLDLSDMVSRLDNLAIQKVIREVGSNDLAKALKGAKEEVSIKLFSNMSKKAKKIMKEKMEYMGNVPKKEILDAQNNIVKIIQNLLDGGR